MRYPSSMTREATDAGRPVLPWRLVVGALLHFIVPAYLYTLLATWLVEGAPTHALLGEAVRVSGKFLILYAAFTLLAALLARALDPALRRRRARREAGDPALASRASAERVATATARAARLASGTVGEPVAAAVTALRHAAWDHADERDQKLSVDLADAVDAFLRAHASAGVDGKPEVATLAAAALNTIAAALDDLADERRRLDHGDALTHARYLNRKYQGEGPESLP